LVDEDLQIFGDTLIRVVGLRPRDRHRVVSAIGQPVLEIFVSEPAPPAHLQKLREIKRIHVHDDPHTSQQGKAQDLPIELGFVLVLERVEEQVLPCIDLHVHVDHAQREREDCEQQQARDDFLLRKPVGLEQGPEVAPKTRSV
jgi:hypothetical protein